MKIHSMALGSLNNDINEVFTSVNMYCVARFYADAPIVISCLTILPNAFQHHQNDDIVESKSFVHPSGRHEIIQQERRMQGAETRHASFRKLV